LHDALLEPLLEPLYLVDEADIVRYKTVAGSRDFKPADWAVARVDVTGPPI